MPRVRLAGALLSAWLASCGAAAPSAEVPDRDACRAAIARAAGAWGVLAARTEEAARPEGAEPLAVERALDRLEAHADALAREPREVDGEEAFALSSAMMDAIDAAGARLPPGLHEHAERAAEALLTDRDRDGAARAARDAAQVLEQVAQAGQPGSLEPRAGRRALEALARRARDAEQAYRHEGGESGDRRAGRAELAALPDGAPAAVRDARERALDASAAVRRACGIERRLTTPALER